MGDTYRVEMHERYTHIVKNDTSELVRLDHSPNLSFKAGSDLVHRAWHLAGAGDVIELQVENGVIFACRGGSCPYA